MRTKYTKDDKTIFKKISKNIKFYFINNQCSSEITDEYGRITMEQLAELSNSSSSMIANILAENVDQTFSIVFLRNIAKALNTPLYAFFLDKPIKNPPEDPFDN